MDIALIPACDSEVLGQVAHSKTKEYMMPYGAKGSLGGSGVLAATGISTAGWVIWAVTLIFLGMALVQLVRPRSALRP